MSSLKMTPKSMGSVGAVIKKNVLKSLHLLQVRQRKRSPTVQTQQTTSFLSMSLVSCPHSQWLSEWSVKKSSWFTKEIQFQSAIWLLHKVEYVYFVVLFSNQKKKQYEDDLEKYHVWHLGENTYYTLSSWVKSKSKWFSIYGTIDSLLGV